MWFHPLKITFQLENKSKISEDQSIKRCHVDLLVFKDCGPFSEAPYLTVELACIGNCIKFVRTIICFLLSKDLSSTQMRKR